MERYSAGKVRGDLRKIANYSDVKESIWWRDILALSKVSNSVMDKLSIKFGDGNVALF